MTLKRHQKVIEGLKIAIKAQKDVNEVAKAPDKGMIGKAAGAVFNMVANASEAVVGPRQEVIKYKWENSEWGKLIAEEREGITFAQFKKNMHGHKMNVLMYEQQLATLESELRAVQERLNNEDQYKAFDVEGKDSFALEEQWKAQVKALEEELNQPKQISTTPK